MNYSAIDPILTAWATQNRVTLSTKYQDVEVRSFQLVWPGGRAQIWIEMNDGMTVHVWDYRRLKQTFVADSSTLSDRLDQALRLARVWCGDLQQDPPR
jgi:hypothetical protein